VGLCGEDHPPFHLFFCLILLVRVSGAPYAFNQPSLSLSLTYTLSSLSLTHTIFSLYSIPHAYTHTISLILSFLFLSLTYTLSLSLILSISLSLPFLFFYSLPLPSLCLLLTPSFSLSLSLTRSYCHISFLSTLNFFFEKNSSDASVRAAVRPNHSFSARCADDRASTPTSTRPPVNRVVGSCDYRKNIAWVHPLDICNLSENVETIKT